MTVNVVMSRSISAGAKLCPRAYGEPQTGQRHDLPTRRTCVREQEPVLGGHVPLRLFLASLLLAGKGKTRGQRRRKLSLDPHLGHSAQFCGWPFSHVVRLPPTSHFSASGAAAGAKCCPPTRPLLRVQHTTRGSPPAPPGHWSPPSLCMYMYLSLVTPLRGGTTSPGAGNECVWTK